ncbi:aldehyde dehydrogenase family protein [Actinokineospora sp.]|uniref:aldehyde dehydrogenase family protein n=1 Tax=Actinokineospora sp. TaxID=1872133 RepID=UPI004037D722
MVAPPAPAADSATVPFAERLDGLAAVAAFLDTDRAAVLDILTEVTMRRAAEYEVLAARDTLLGAPAEVAAARPAALASAAVFMPSNVVLYSYVLYLLVPSLFVESAAFRPSSQVRAQTVALHELLAPVHGLPVRLEDTSQRRFAQDTAARADLVVFTGRYENSEKILSLVDDEQLFVFLGQGANPIVLAEDADLDLACADAVDIRLLNSGQDCLGPDVLFVPTASCEEFVARLTARLDGLRAGRYVDPDADYGPLWYDSAWDTVATFLSRHRDRIVHGGNLDFRHRVVPPTVLVSSLRDRPPLTEFFAPVFNVVTYPDFAALGAVLGVDPFAEHALGASVYGTVPDSFLALLRRRHTVTLNTSLASVDDGNRPFGGYGRMANYTQYRGKRDVSPVLVSEVVGRRWGRS